jgi:hypothetical protein
MSTRERANGTEPAAERERSEVSLAGSRDPRHSSDDVLPVTAEVGSEGGSYAEPRNQTATFSGPANPNIAPVDAIEGRMSIATETAASGPLAGTSMDRADDTLSGMVRYPTEPPSPADATEGRRVGGTRWRKGLIGVAAGTAALIGVSRLRRRT